MAKYLMFWELDKARIPVDLKDRGDGFDLLMAMVQQDREKGLTKDWGAFVGEMNGYCVVEGTEVEVGNMINQYAPYVYFKTYPAASFDQVAEIVSMLGK